MNTKPYIMPAAGVLNAFSVLLGALAVVLIAMALEALVYRVCLTRGISYRRRFSTHAAYRGEKILLEETVTNGKLVPVPWAMTEMTLPGVLTETADDAVSHAPRLYRAVTYLPGRKSVQRSQHLVCRHRGVYALGGSTLELRELFGFARERATFFTQEELYVYPAILPQSELPLALLRYQGDVTARRWIQPDPILVAGVREYTPQDALRDVHWPATARTGELQVKVRDFTISPRLMVLVNVADRPGLWAAMEPERQELAEPILELAATLCDWAVDQGLEIGFGANTAPESGMGTPFLYFPPAAGATRHEELLRAMARMVIQCRVDFTALLDRLTDDGVTAMDVLILTRYRSPEMDQRIAALQAQNNNVSAVVLDVGEEAAYA